MTTRKIGGKKLVTLNTGTDDIGALQIISDYVAYKNKSFIPGTMDMNHQD